MPTYDFLCEPCNVVYADIYQPIASTTRTITCERCNGDAHKIMAFPALKKSMPEHFNQTLGRPVTNEADFRSGLREKADEASARSGRDVSYSQVDLRDKEALGITDEGLDATRRREVATGQREVVKHFT